MTKLPQLLVFIVAYQGETTIEKVLRRIPAALVNEFDVIMDDGSQDATFAVGVNGVAPTRCSSN